MTPHMEEGLLAFILLTMAVVMGIDQLAEETAASLFMTGVLTGLTIAASVVYTYRAASRSD